MEDMAATEEDMEDTEEVMEEGKSQINPYYRAFPKPAWSNTLLLGISENGRWQLIAHLTLGSCYKIHYPPPT